jgi:exopolysaccharide production protein ExoZ
MFFYLAFAASLLIARGQLFLIGAFLALAGSNLVINPESFMLSFYTDPIILEFVAGTLLARMYMAGVRIPAWSSVLLLAAAIAAFLALEPLELGRFARAVGWGLPATMVVGALILRPEPGQSGLVRQILQAGGDASYTIYLSHTFTINGLAILMTRIPRVPDALALCCAVLASIAASVLFFRLVELPFTNRLQRVAFGHRMPSIQNVAP